MCDKHGQQYVARVSVAACTLLVLCTRLDHHCVDKEHMAMQYSIVDMLHIHTSLHFGADLNVDVTAAFTVLNAFPFLDRVSEMIFLL